jgi:heterodisulfide reductase subunit B
LASEQKKEDETQEEYAYYPGCSLHGTAHEYDESVQEVAGLLNIRLAELEDWNCCGASSAHMTDHGLAVELAARNIRIAERTGKDLMIPCAACFHRLKAAEKAIGAEAEQKGGQTPQIGIYHLSDWLRRPESLRKIRDAVQTPLKGMRLVPYYGCLITRPPSVTDSKEPEDPKSMDLLIRILGGEAKRWSYKTECCGGSLTLGRSDITNALVSRIVKAAVQADAQGILTMCPMCQANLESNQLELKQQDAGHPVLPIFYATELIAACITGPTSANRWKAHLVDPSGLLSPLGL